MARRVCITASVLAALVFLGCASRQTFKIEEGEKPAKSHVMFSGGNGDSPENAVRVTGAQDQKEVFASENEYIAQKRGRKGKDWKAVGHSSLREGGKVYDIVEIEMLPARSRDYFYFDISGCSWKP